MTDACVAADQWFARRGWQPFGFQREVWVAIAAGRSGLLHATTGSGKTYAVWMGALARGAQTAAGTARGLQVLWLCQPQHVPRHQSPPPPSGGGL